MKAKSRFWVCMQVNNDFKQEMNKFRDYLKALSNYKRAQVFHQSLTLLAFPHGLVAKAGVALMLHVFARRAKFFPSRSVLSGRHARPRTTIPSTRTFPATTLTWDTLGLMSSTFAAISRRYATNAQHHSFLDGIDQPAGKICAHRIRGCHRCSPDDMKLDCCLFLETWPLPNTNMYCGHRCSPPSCRRRSRKRLARCVTFPSNTIYRRSKHGVHCSQL